MSSVETRTPVVNAESSGQLSSLSLLMEEEQENIGGELELVETDVIGVTKEDAMPPKEEKLDSSEESKKIPPVSLCSFKPESNKLEDLSERERIALYELRCEIQKHLNSKGQLQDVSEKNPAKRSEEGIEPRTSIWGVPLLEDDRSDVVLLKFLRARDFKVSDALSMIKDTIQWRAHFQIDKIENEDLGDDWDQVVFMQGKDRNGHPVCYNVYSAFQNKELYQKTFSDEGRRKNFLRWRIQSLEKSVRELDYHPAGVSTIFQVNDLKNSPGPAKRELRLATREALLLLQDNYPEFVAKQIFINVPWWYLAFYSLLSPFLTQRTKSKLVFAGPSKTSETLLKYISPEQVPVQYGGLSMDCCDCNREFTIDDPATYITLKPGTKQTVEIIVYEQCDILWELRVVEWEVTYGAEFVPEKPESYTIIIQKPTKMAPTDEPVLLGRFKVSELGKILLTVDNPTPKKKLLVYRFKVKPLSN